MRRAEKDLKFPNENLLSIFSVNGNGIRDNCVPRLRAATRLMPLVGVARKALLLGDVGGKYYSILEVS